MKRKTPKEVDRDPVYKAVAHKLRHLRAAVLNPSGKWGIYATPHKQRIYAKADSD